MRDWVDGHVETWSKELDWFDPVHEAVVARLAILGRYVSARRSVALDAGGLAHGEFKILLALRRLGAPYTTSPSALADRLGLTRGALSARLAPLDDAGLLTRATDRDDRRRVHVTLTAAGSAALDRHLATENRDERELLGALDADELRTLADLLRKLVVGTER